MRWLWGWACVALSLGLFGVFFFPTGERGGEEDGGDGRMAALCGGRCEEVARKKEDFSSMLPSPYDRVVLIVIDGMRADFAREMTFLQQKIRDGDGLAYISAAAAPTVTLPRIKALMSGQPAHFSDFLFNFHPQSTTSDNLLYSLRKEGRRIHFYGDDTWLKLYPDAFDRSEGVVSFYVTDTVEVDLNVTRNLKRDLSLPPPSPTSSLTQNTWHLLIGHYLGLDHIGHLGGEADPRLSPKLTEMDSVIQFAYSALFPSAHHSSLSLSSPSPPNLHSFSPATSSLSSPSPSPPSSSNPFSSKSLIMIASDHGMTERGTHGGSTEKETDAFLAFLSPGLGMGKERGEGGRGEEGERRNKNRREGDGERERRDETEREEGREMEKREGRMERVSQLDFAATAACLMGVSMPRLSEGRVLLSPLSLLGVPHSLFCSLENAMQLLRVRDVSAESALPIANALDRSLMLHESCLACSLPPPLSPPSSPPTSSPPSTPFSPPPPPFPFCRDVCRDSLASYSSLFDLLSSSSFPSLSPHRPVYALTLIGVFAVALFSLSRLFSFPALFPSLSFSPLLLLFGFACKIAHFLSLFSSSLVEEEHQTFYFVAPSFLLLLLLQLLFSRSRSPSTPSPSLSPSLHFSLTLPAGTTHLLILLSLHVITRKWTAAGVKILQSKDEDRLWESDASIFSDFLLSLTSPFSRMAVVFASFSSLTFVSLSLDADLRRRVLSLHICVRAFLYLLVAVSCAVAVALKSSVFFFGFSEVDLGVAFYASLLSLSAFILALSLSRRSLSLLPLLHLPASLFLFALLRLHLLPLLSLVSLQRVCMREFVCRVLREKRNASKERAANPSRERERKHEATAVEEEEEPYDPETERVCALFLATVSDGVTWLSRSSYFLFGNGNAISAIDFAGAYVGFSSFSPSLIPLLIFLSVFAGPLAWLPAHAKVLLSLDPPSAPALTDERKGAVEFIWWNLLFLRSLSALGVGAACLAFREHLFAWSVFAPKLLFEGAWVVFDTVQVLVLYFIVFLAKYRTKQKRG